MEMTNFKILVWLYQNLGNIEPARAPDVCFLILARAEVPVSARTGYGCAYFAVFARTDWNCGGTRTQVSFFDVLTH